MRERLDLRTGIIDAHFAIRSRIYVINPSRCDAKVEWHVTVMYIVNAVQRREKTYARLNAIGPASAKKFVVVPLSVTDAVPGMIKIKQRHNNDVEHFWIGAGTARLTDTPPVFDQLGCGVKFYILQRCP